MSISFRPKRSSGFCCKLCVYANLIIYIYIYKEREKRQRERERERENERERKKVRGGGRVNFSVCTSSYEKGQNDMQPIFLGQVERQLAFVEVKRWVVSFTNLVKTVSDFRESPGKFQNVLLILSRKIIKIHLRFAISCCRLPSGGKMADLQGYWN